YLHSTGASAFFIVVYLHMFRALLYGSYRAPRELLWLIGMLVYLALMAEAFMGYVLPWGNMSFWGAQVIVNLFGTIPGIGKPLVEWIRGDYGIADATLNRFFALHVAAIPLALLLLVMLHLVALRQTGSNNPDGIEIKARLGADGKPLDGIPFHPYYTVKDIVGVGVFLVLFALVVFFKPTLGGLFLEAPNFEPANPISTPEHITPVWYFTPYYALLRAVPDQRMGALLMLLAVVSFFFLPWLDRSPVKSMRYRGWTSRTALPLFVVAFVALGYLGLQPASDAAWLKRGALNFVGYCLGCHSLKYERWSRLGQDLAVPQRLLQTDLLPPGDPPTEYIRTSMPAADAKSWFGKTPPGLALMARARGGDYLYQLFKTYYVDPTRPTGANNLRLPNIAMPHVLSELEGLKRAVFRDVVRHGEGGTEIHEQVFDHFEQIAPGRLGAAEYDGFVRDTVNFLDYVGEPTQTARRALGIWVVLFLLVFSWLAWLVKREYWKDVH